MAIAQDPSASVNGGSEGVASGGHTKKTGIKVIVVGAGEKKSQSVLDSLVLMV